MVFLHIDAFSTAATMDGMQRNLDLGFMSRKDAVKLQMFSESFTRLTSKIPGTEKLASKYTRI
jgi:hypothetical protein